MSKNILKEGLTYDDVLVVPQKERAHTYEVPIKPIKATRKDFVIRGILFFTSSKSKAASKTIKIKPTTPRTSSMGKRLGFSIPIKRRQ